MITKFWKQHIAFGFHPADVPFMKEEKVIRWTPEQAISHEWDYDSKSNRSKLHENFIPAPFYGNLKRARIFILMLNPGYKTFAYFEDHYDPMCRDLKFNNLAQKNDAFLGLDTRLISCGVYRYWRKTLSPAVEAAAVKTGKSLKEAAQLVARKTAVIQACPYHSVSNPGAWVSKLPSVQIARRYVHDILVPRAKSGEISIIVTRAVKCWDMDPNTKIPHILIRNKNFRSSTLKPDELNEISRHWS